MVERLAVGLSPWIIADGNYADFVVGEQRAFALEFYAPTQLVRQPSGRPSFRHLGKGHYAVTASVTFVAHDWWVLDFGIPAFTNYAPPRDYAIGELLSGELYVGVDPFFYFESLASRPSSPALIFDWRLERIEMESGPFVEKDGVMLRDPDRTVWRDVDRTGASRDDEGAPEYLLHCARLSDNARHTLFP